MTGLEKVLAYFVNVESLIKEGQTLFIARVRERDKEEDFKNREKLNKLIWGVKGLCFWSRYFHMCSY